MSRSRPGLRAEIVLAFVVITFFAVGINTLVVWGLARLLLVQERSLNAEGTARAAARLALGETSVDDALGTALTAPNVVYVLVFDDSGATMAAQGNSDFATQADDDLMQVLADGNEIVRVERRPLGPGGVRATATVKWSDPAPQLDGVDLAALRVVTHVGGDAAAAARFRSLSAFYVALNALLVALIGMWLVSRNLVRPIRSLVDASTRISSGVLDVDVPVGGVGEVADLGRSFNRMAEALREREQEIARQIGELRRTNEGLKRAQEEVLQSEKLAGVGRLAAGVAHEMGNPIGAIVGYVSLLLKQRGDDGSEEAENLRRIEREVQRLDRIIRDLLDYARPRDVELDEVQVNNVIETAASIVAAQKDLLGVKVVLELADSLPRISIDPHRLQQVLVNLLLNAADAMDGDGAIRVGTQTGSFPAEKPMRRREDPAWRPGAAAVEIRVADSGPGIPEDARASLFTPFFTTKEPGKGTGLGLAICQRIVDAAAGRIVVESSGEAGTTFLVQFPVGDLAEDSVVTSQ